MKELRKQHLQRFTGLPAGAAFVAGLRMHAIPHGQEAEIGITEYEIFLIPYLRDAR
jgi:hypothetical protein